MQSNFQYHGGEPYREYDKDFLANLQLNARNKQETATAVPQLSMTAADEQAQDADYRAYGHLGAWADTSLISGKHVLLLFGGKSTEHMVSCRSAAFVAQTLSRTDVKLSLAGITERGEFLAFPYPEAEPTSELWLRMAAAADNSAANLKNSVGISDISAFLASLTCDGSKPDIVFPVMHGVNCEDGVLQGLLKLADIPFVGAGVLASAVGMNKITTKKLLQAANIPMVPWTSVRRTDYVSAAQQVVAAIESEIAYPLFVKPANGGSSVGASKALNQAELLKALEEAFALDTQVLVEEYHQVRELECGVLGNQSDALASVVGEIVVGESAAFYDYRTKYFSATASEACIPARISPQAAREIQELSLKIYQELDLAGLSRVDFFLDKNSNKLYFNEVNTLPGFTSISLYPQVFAACGIDAVHLVSYLLSAALCNYQSEKRQETII